MGTRALTADELNKIVTIERVTSCMSLIGCAFIVVTFLSSRIFHTPINRLVFFASIGNILTNVATLMGTSVVGHPNAALCQFQSFLLQMFMCADAYWTLAMACNVYLTFFHKFDAQKLRTMEKYYLIACYAFPFIPALVYLFIRAPNGDLLYGDATLWCWIGKDFDILRIATYYAPVWMSIFTTFAIYIYAGKEIYTKRQQLLNFRKKPSSHLTRFGGPSKSVKTIEVRVTSEPTCVQNTQDLLDGSRTGHCASENARDPAGGRGSGPSERPLYSVSVSSSKVAEIFEKQKDVRQLTSSSSVHNETGSRTAVYPSEHGHLSRPYVVMEANSAAWSYTKVAVLFFTAMLVTWIPSSANRVYSVAHPGYMYPPLQFASALVLPLQGFWNAVIYTTTSWEACRRLLTSYFFYGTKPISLGPVSFDTRRKGDILPSHDNKIHGSESTTELAYR